MFLEVLKGTPWWVYFIFVYLLFLGVKALKSQIFSVKRIFILPAFFLIWSIYVMSEKFESGSDIFVWLFFVVIGFSAGWGWAKHFRIKADKKKLLIKVPGSPTFIIMFMAIFVTKYFFGYYTATHTDGSELIHFAQLITFGLITGILTGRTFCFLKKFAAAKHEKLTKGGGPTPKIKF